MARLIPRTLNSWLLMAGALALPLGWLTGYFTAGGAVSVTALCIVAIRSPRLALIERWPLCRWLARHSEAADTETPPAAPPLAARPRRAAVEGQPASLVEKMIAQGRVALLLRPQIAANLRPTDLETAQAALDEAMAIVPDGDVLVRARCYDQLDDDAATKAERLVHAEGFFLDRYAVSNRDYLEFVEDGGYEQMSLWDEAIWPAVLSFVDRSGQPGPRFWENGIYPAGLDDHPVVGVSWYEACAFARWAGKRLPTDPEWVKAASWPMHAEGAKPVQRRFPWGDAMDRGRVNLGGSRSGTVAVHALPAGASVNGVEQLIGNVWEWTTSAFGAWEPPGRKIETAMPLKSIRGGAFDTYFDTQAHCQFQSGESPLARKHNIGFRCALGFCDVAHMSGPEPAATEPKPTARAVSLDRETPSQEARENACSTNRASGDACSTQEEVLV